MDNQVEAAEPEEIGETEGEELCPGDLIGGVDHKSKATGLIKLLSAFTRLDVNKASEETGIPSKALLHSLPATFAQSLSKDCLGLLLTPESVGEFVAEAIDTINALACAIVSMTSDIDPKLVSQLISYMADYCDAEGGTTAEVFAQQRTDETIAAINEAIFNKNPSLAAGFVDDEIGFTLMAANAMSEYDSVDEEDDEAEDEESVPPTRHG